MMLKDILLTLQAKNLNYNDDKYHLARWFS